MLLSTVSGRIVPCYENVSLLVHAGDCRTIGDGSLLAPRYRMPLACVLLLPERRLRCNAPLRHHNRLQSPPNKVLSTLNSG